MRRELPNQNEFNRKRIAIDNDSPLPGEVSNRRILRYTREVWGNYNLDTTGIQISRHLEGLPLRAISVDAHCQALGGWVGHGLLTNERGAANSLKNVLSRLTASNPFLVDADLEDDMWIVPERLYVGATPAAYTAALAAMNPQPGTFERFRSGLVYGTAAPFAAFQAHYGERPSSFPEKRAPLRFWQTVTAPTGGALPVARVIVTGREKYSVIGSDLRATNTWTIYGVVEHGNNSVRTALATGTDDFAYTGSVAFDVIEVDMNDTAGTDAVTIYVDAWDD